MTHQWLYLGSRRFKSHRAPTRRGNRDQHNYGGMARVHEFLVSRTNGDSVFTRWLARRNVPDVLGAIRAHSIRAEERNVITFMAGMLVGAVVMYVVPRLLARLLGLPEEPRWDP